jgi:PadR family transcriptional regulator PadR
MVTVYSIEHNSRLRKYYKLTETGRQKIEDFKNEWKEVMTVYNFITAERECGK